MRPFLSHTSEEDNQNESYFGRFKDGHIYKMEFINLANFTQQVEWSASNYNTQGLHSSLNYMTPDEFESPILNDDFKKKWLKKKLRGTNMFNYLNAL